MKSPIILATATLYHSSSLFQYSIDAFSVAPSVLHPLPSTASINTNTHSGSLLNGKNNRNGSTITYMAAGSGGGGSKKKRRRRKKPAAVSDTPSTPSPASDITPPPSPPKPVDLASLKAELLDPVAPDGPISSTSSSSKTSLPSDVEVLPDIRDVLKKKEQKKLDEDNEMLRKTSRPKIKRSDKEAFIELLQAEPFADADDSFFEEEEYGTVSALLGEGALEFLGIPPGPLQVGHFILALGIMLCAFVEYPGFPLTNLPTPLRGSLQGGLATIYAINFVLAILAFFKAGERGQSGVLWAAKTFSVGGLAFDQLTQLPTIEESKQIGKR